MQGPQAPHLLGARRCVTPAPLQPPSSVPDCPPRPAQASLTRIQREEKGGWLMGLPSFLGVQEK